MSHQIGVLIRICFQKTVKEVIYWSMEEFRGLVNTHKETNRFRQNVEISYNTWQGRTTVITIHGRKHLTDTRDRVYEEHVRK